MSKKSSILLGVLILLSGQVSSQVADSLAVNSLIHQGMHFTIEQSYPEALERFRRVTDLDCENPAGYFFQAAVFQSMMMDYETDQWEKEFYRLVDQTICRARKRIRKNREDAWAHFYLGGALGYKAFYQGRQKRYLSAFRNGLLAMSELERALEIDSTLYDAYLGIGNYKYWRSRLTQLLNWLPFVEDQREEGIQMIRLAMEKGQFSKYVAANDLAWILMDAGRVGEAVKLSQMGLGKYPRSRFFLWCAAEGHFRLRKFPQAIRLYQQILDSIQNEELNNHYNEIICRVRMAQGYFQLGNYKESLRECEAILALNLDKKIKKRTNKWIKEAEELKSKCHKKVAQK